MNILQYASDLHLELRKIDTIPVINPIKKDGYENYLALCGDIGNPYIDTYKAFLDIHTKLYTHILIISGNHEYYTSKSKQYTMTDMDSKLVEITKEYENITYLNMDKLIIGRTKFIGCTLWSDISEIGVSVEEFMNDYKNIYVENIGTPNRTTCIFNGIYQIKSKIKSDRSKLTSYHVLRLHREMRYWLQSEIDKYHNNTNTERRYDNIIILTHHAPSFQMLDKSDIYSPCYATDCENMMGPPVKYWISGHTHTSKEININGTTCMSNCMGYPGQKGTNYNDEKYVIFD